MITCEKGHDPWDRPCKHFKEERKDKVERREDGEE